MDRHIREYFSEFSEGEDAGNFHKVLALHESPDFDWEILSAEVTNLPRGWFELARLSSADRVEFSKAHHLRVLPYRLEAHERIASFFDRLDDIGVYVTQATLDDPYEVQLVYSLANDSGFYHGFAPATEASIAELQQSFSGVMLPEDFLAFLRIHDGFSKYTDTGMTRVANLLKGARLFREDLSVKEPLKLRGSVAIDPGSLIPFYESFGLNGYQCFWSDWYPEQEMGNVYYSGIEHSLSDPAKGSPSETLAFPTFLDWLAFYLEPVES